MSRKRTAHYQVVSDSFEGPVCTNLTEAWRGFILSYAREHQGIPQLLAELDSAVTFKLKRAPYEAQANASQ